MWNEQSDRETVMSESAPPDSILPGDSMSQNRPLAALPTSPKPSSSLRQGSSTPMPVVPEGGFISSANPVQPTADKLQRPGQHVGVDEATLETLVEAKVAAILASNRDRTMSENLTATMKSWESPCLDWQSLYGVHDESGEGKAPGTFGGNSADLQEMLKEEDNPLARIKLVTNFVEKNFIPAAEKISSTNGASCATAIIDLARGLWAEYCAIAESKRGLFAMYSSYITFPVEYIHTHTALKNMLLQYRWWPDYGFSPISAAMKPNTRDAVRHLVGLFIFAYDNSEDAGTALAEKIRFAV